MFISSQLSFSSRLHVTKCEDIGLRGDINWINSGVNELQVGEGSHVNARAATKGFGNLVKFGLKFRLGLGGGINHATVGSFFLRRILLDLVHEERLDGVGLGSGRQGRGVGAQAAPEGRKQEHKVSYRCSLPSPLQKGSKDWEVLIRLIHKCEIR